MTDVAYMNAQRQREGALKAINEHQQALDDARGELLRIDTFLKEWRRFAEVEEPDAPDAPAENVIGPVNHDPSPPPQIVAQQPQANPTKAQVVEAAKEAIEAVGRPLLRIFLLNALQHKGLRIGGRDPASVLNTMLWRSQDQIVRLKGHGYWLADREYAPADYYPDRGAPSEGTETEAADSESLLWSQDATQDHAEG